MKVRLAISFCLWLAAISTALAAERPNIVFILTDNQGAWQLGCYGNPDFVTPNIDRMAREGVRFTNAFANNAVCSPTRATYLTGLTPSQHGVHRYLAKGRLQVGPEASYTLEEFTTLPEILHREGYVCGLSGKWHLGDNLNPQDGFSFWVTKPAGHSPGFLNQEVIEDGKIGKVPQHLSEYWTDRGIEFVEKSRREHPDRPFFLFLAYNGPYTLSGAMREPVPSPWSDPYVTSDLPSFPRPDKIHPWQRNQHDLIGDLQAGRNLAGQVTAVDAGVGRIMAMLKEKGLDENTLVIYAADQGAVAGHAGFWGMGDHTMPLHGRDGTMHIPMIFRQPGSIPSGKTVDQIVTNYDFMPSLLSYLDLEMPSEPLPSPGRDFSAALAGEKLEGWDDVVYYEFENVRSIRTTDWKYVERLGEAPEVELFDLKADPDELKSVAGSAAHAVLQGELQSRLHDWFKRYSDPEWDLWNGGAGKSRIGTAAKIAEGIRVRQAATGPPKARAKLGAVVPETDHTLILSAGEAALAGSSMKVNPKHGALAWWKSADDVATWKVRGAKNGTYVVALDYAVPAKLAGQQFVVRAGESTLKANAVSTGGWGRWVVRAVGEIEITQPDLEVSFAPSQKVKGEDLLDLRALQLIPIGSPRLANLEPVEAKEKAAAVIPADRKIAKGNAPAPVSPGRDGVFLLTGKNASLFGAAIGLHPGDRPVIAGWNRKGDRASWQLRGLKAGRYDLLADWAMARAPGGLQKVAVNLDGEQIFTGNVRTTEGDDRFARYVIGTIELPGGDHELAFGPNGNARTWVRLRGLRLVPAAGSGEFTIPPLTVPEGFVIEPAAAPPLVSHPMMACLDDRGRLFVAESAGTNAKAPELLETRPHKILMLEDADGDGVFDRSTVFADDMVLPNGAQWHDGALYVCSPPYIWKLEDTTGDGRADVQTPVGGKFGFNGMSSAFHGPVLGPDGRLYYCGGQHGWTHGDTSPGLDLEGPWVSRGPGVFSMWPNGDDPENRAQGGMANPVEVTFSSEGEVFGTVAVYQNLNGRTDALLHWIHGTVYNMGGRRGPPVHPATSRRLLDPMSRRGWVAPPGLCRYRTESDDHGFGHAYRDDIFLTEFNTHRVYRIMPERKGASYTTTDEIFLESTSPYTHFTDVFEDADGSLLVVDTGGWFLYGCPTSAIERPQIEGAIYRIRREDAKPVDDPRGLKLDWAKPSVDWLDDPRFAVRDRAKAVLAKQGEAILPAIEKILTDDNSSERHRREAVWTLTRMESPAAQSLVIEALFDSSASVRLTAARSCSTRRIRDAAGVLLMMLTNDDPAIRREAATALGRLGVAGSPVQSLFAAVEENSGADPYLDHSLIYALIEIDHWTYTRTFLRHENPHVQRAALIAGAEMKSSELTAEEVAPHLASADPDLRGEALRLATARPEWGGSFIGFLKSSLAAESVPPAIADALLAFSANAKVQRLIAEALEKDSTRAAALDVIRRAALKTTPEIWKAALLDRLVSAPDAALIETVGKLAAEGRLDATEFELEWVKLATGASGDAATRLAAIDIAYRDGGAPPVDAIFKFLADRFEPGNPISQRVLAAGILGRLTLTDDQQRACAELASKAGPLEIGSFLGAFRSEASSQTLDALADSLAESPALFSVSASQLETVFGEHAGGAQLIARLHAVESERDRRLDELAASIAPVTGDAERGKAAFAKAACVVCHKAKGEGGIIGPELTTIGAIRSERDLLEAIAYPSATFAREYEPFIVTLKDKSVMMGRLGGETRDTLELIDAQGLFLRIPASEIANREMAAVSMMPAGLERLLTPQELADLMVYLKQLK